MAKIETDKKKNNSMQNTAFIFLSNCMTFSCVQEKHGIHISKKTFNIQKPGIHDNTSQQIIYV